MTLVSLRKNHYFLISLGNGLLFQEGFQHVLEKHQNFYYYSNSLILIMRILGSQGSIMAFSSSLIIRGSIGLGVGGE